MIESTRGAGFAVITLALLTTGCASAGPTATQIESPPASTVNSSRAPSATLGWRPSASSRPATSSASPGESASASPDIAPLPVGRVVFDRYLRGPEGRYLDTLTIDASGLETKIDFPVAATERRAIWSPDGTKLLVDSWSSQSGGSVSVFDPTRNENVSVEPKGLSGDFDCSDWSPDGLALLCAVSSETKTDDGIYSVTLADMTVKRLTHSPYHFVEGSAGACGGGENRAVFSGDGTRFAYEQQKCGTGPDPSSDEQGAIIVVNADGSHPSTVVDFGGVLTHPGGEISWSPTSNLIAFGTPDGRLAVVDADEAELRTIYLPVPGFVMGPTWSPDGRWILVGIDAEQGSDLYAVAPDGSQAVQITHSTAFEGYTDWGTSP